MEFSNLNGYDVKDKVAREEMNILNDSYYDEITYKKERLNDTDCYITEIPLNDSNNNLISPYVGYSNTLTPTEYARKNKTSLTINATLSVNQGDSTYKDAVVIANGEVIHTYDGIPITDDYHYYLGIKADRTFKDYLASSTTPQDMINDGVMQGFLTWYRLVKDGVAVPQTIDNATSKHPRQCIGIKQDGTIVILTCDGRTTFNAGLTSEQCSNILISEGCINAWNLDGGGSTSTTINGSKLNRNIDNDGTIDRKIDYTLNIKKSIINEGISEAFSKIGEEKQNVIEQLMGYINEFKYKDITGLNLNNLVGSVIVGYGNGATNKPTSENGYFINIPHSTNPTTYNTQLWIAREKYNVYLRQMVNGVFNDWIKVSNSDISYFIADNYSLTTGGDYEKVYIKRYRSNCPQIDVDPTTILQEGADTYSGFIINKIGYYKVKANIEINASTSGTKYMALYKNGSKIDASTCRFYATASQPTNATLEFFDNNDNVENKYEVRVYGTSGDTIVRFRVFAETV